MQRVGINAGFCKGVAEELVAFALTNGGGKRRVEGRVHREGHGHHGVAAVNSVKGGVLCTGFGEGDTVPFVRQFAGADGLGIGGGEAFLDNEGDRDDGVATVGGNQRVILRASLSEFDTLVGVRQLAGADGPSVNAVHYGIDIQNHSHHGVATVHRL